MIGLKLRRVNPGDAVYSYDEWNRMLDLIERAQIIPGQTTGIAVRTGKGGTTLSLTSSGANGQLCVTSTTISAATAFSGSPPTATAGTGTVIVCSTDPSTKTISQTNETLTVFNFSTFTGGIASGVSVWVEQDQQGNYWIVSADCGN